MRRVLVGGLAALLWATPARAQGVPARDLWEFPLGALFEPPALAVEPGAGLWNPATAALSADARFRFGVASFSTGPAQGVDGQILTGAWRRPSGVSWGLSIARAAVAGLVYTDSDPQTLGDIPYTSSLVSLTAAREILPHVTGGTALRWRYGRADQLRRDAMALDFGVVVHDLPILNTRLAASSFLWRPGREIEDRPAVLLAADFRVVGPSAEREVRLGAAQMAVNRGARERGPFVSARFDRLEARAQMLRVAAGGRTLSRFRSGLALYYARYTVGVSREEGTSGLGPVYQFTLSSLIK